MDFLFYLTPVGTEIIKLVSLSGTKIQENVPICKKYTEVFGYSEYKKFTICTENIKNTISPVKHYVNETVNHEAVHLAQSCKGGTLGIKNPLLSPDKLDEVRRSSSYEGAAFKYELEAYYLENKPEQVLDYIKKYCF